MGFKHLLTRYSEDIGCNRVMLKPFSGQIPILSNMSNGLKAPFSTIHPESFATKSSTVEMFGH